MNSKNSVTSSIDLQFDSSNWLKLKNWYFSIPEVADQLEILTKILDFLAKSHNMSDSELVSLLDQKSENLWSCWFDLFNKGDEKALLSRGKLFCLLDQARLDINLSKFDLPPRDGIFRDLRGVPCPNNRAKAQVELGKFIGPHDFCFWLDPGSPIENVPSALVALGFEIKQRVQSESINRLEQENQTLTPENYWSLEGLKK